MGCCGKARANLSVMRAVKAPAPVPASGIGPKSAAMAVSSAGAAPLQLRYLGPSAIAVRGPMTGTSYSFSQAHPLGTVDQRDAVMLLRTGYFRRDSA